LIQNLAAAKHNIEYGRIRRLAPAEALARYGTLLMREGLSSADIDLAMKHNPSLLVA